jgi:hypothetical protein
MDNDTTSFDQSRFDERGNEVEFLLRSMLITNTHIRWLSQFDDDNQLIENRKKILLVEK